MSVEESEKMLTANSYRKLSESYRMNKEGLTVISKSKNLDPPQLDYISKSDGLRQTCIHFIGPLYMRVFTSILVEMAGTDIHEDGLNV